MTSIASLPPTINALNPSQRARLRKSTRKLGDILGATPHVLDADLFPIQPSKSPHPTPVREKRQGVQTFPSHSAASSVISLPGAAKSDDSITCQRPPRRTPPPIDIPSKTHYYGTKPTTQPPRPLVLRLRPMPLLTTNADTKRSTPSSSDFLDLPSPAPSTTTPISPLFSPNKDSANPDNREKIRRRRMAKLTRTLGENIPPELVFCPHHQKSPSEPPVCSPWRQSEEWNQSKSQHRHSKPTTATTEAFTTASSPAALAPPPVIRTHKRRSLSLDALAPDTIVSLVSRTEALLPSSPLARTSSTVRRPKETEWNGEWNVKDAEKRAMALRNLRGR